MNTNRQILNLYPIDYPFETLVSRAESNPRKLILNPDFQRKYKWDKDGNVRASRFIESCLMRIPIPACYLAENENNYHNVIDGVQRITTIKNFFADGFMLEGLTIYPELNGKKFSELGDFKSALESTTMRCIVLRKENPKELVREIFARLNQGAVKLSDQEIRHAIYPGVLDSLLSELGEHEFISEFQNSKSKDDRSNEELILRFFALNNDLIGYSGKLSVLLDDYMADEQSMEEKRGKDLKELFLGTLNRCLKTFEKPFVDTTLAKPRQSVTYYDLLMHSFSSLTDGFIEQHKDELNQKFIELCQLPEFSKTLAGGLQQKSAILKRRELWENKLNEI
ncbi:DUF262 domain-containing protein [Ancylomarina sp. 16SWW S1-10-2]|uniref:DUF262 domain-containing protein n=1 Tax=Ancylomarina sp. 16SWW S1-10-2 TaxID=2499681 RepID=UPI0012AE4C19|nr:DUF262 domain-containing protein [Ancylomarina sp. 16SWW S1-10-2]MRT94043.1 DUF262 domain-containing protein [Ancylomarina sp. 16SWW S1-10-2]